MINKGFFRRAIPLTNFCSQLYIYVNTPEQNGHIESFHKTLKECIWSREFMDLREARRAILGAFDDYNNNRIHSSLGYLTPSEFAETWKRQEVERLENKRIIGSGRCE